MSKQHGPWVIKKTTQKYKNPWIEVNEDKVIRPDGKEGIFGTVKMKDGVSVLPIDEDRFVYLTDEFHYAMGKNGAEVVSGAIDDGESPLEAAKRELKEELGIEAEEWTDLGQVDPFTTIINSTDYLFLARRLRFGKPAQEGTEIIKKVKISLDRAAEMVMKSEIIHSLSCVLILKAKEYLKTE